jgi:hypothetical protein
MGRPGGQRVGGRIGQTERTRHHDYKYALQKVLRPAQFCVTVTGVSEQPDPTNIDSLYYEQLADRLGEVEGVHYDEDRAVMARAADILRVVGVLGTNADGLADFIIDTRQQIAQANKTRDAALAQVEEFKRREHARFVGALSVPPEVFVDLNAIPRLYATGDIVIKTDGTWVHVIRGEPT